MRSLHLPHGCVVRPACRGTAVKRGLAAGAAILVLSSTSGCMVEAMYAVPIALNGAATSIARALPPVDETKYIVHTPRVPPGEPLLAKASSPQPTSPALADASKRPPSPGQMGTSALPAEPTSPTVAADSPAPMPVLNSGALARRGRM